MDCPFYKGEAAEGVPEFTGKVLLSHSPIEDQAS